MSETAALPIASQAVIDRFIDALWLEDGLSTLTLAAYRRDLGLLAAWLHGQQDRALAQTRESDLLAYMAARHAATRATTANRRLSVFRRFFRWAVREHLVEADPTLRLLAARQPLRVPHTLSETQVEALLAAPDTTHPLGVRDRCMLELMYASGLRVSELVQIKTVQLGMNEGVLRVSARARANAWCPSATRRTPGSRATSAEARGEILGAQPRRLVRDAPGPGHDAADVLAHRQEAGAAGRHRRAPVTAHPAPRLCDAPAEPRCRPARGADAAGPRRHRHHHHLHPRGARAAAPVARAASPTGLMGAVAWRQTACGRAACVPDAGQGRSAVPR
jgi:integrase